MEAVVFRALDGPEINAFVCIANKIWEREAPSDDEIPYQSDTISSSNMLIDSMVTDGKTFRSNVTVLPRGPLEAVITAIGQSLPQLEYNHSTEKAKTALINSVKRPAATRESLCVKATCGLGNGTQRRSNTNS
jgi:hypothetical protein